eukprot:TRINITY_DN5170_c0_g1_i1.p1 TRINITY_DN5170_c0_g1~~TRINITY_DN5170_c0_g1_i1.p1  ORF type:complete len:488 (+),score=41.10 TRINITY_DN5170_c0_g1_i1:36-1499(+)
MQFITYFATVIVLCSSLAKGQVQQSQKQDANVPGAQFMGEVKYDVKSNGPLDGNYFLPGDNKPLSNQEIATQLDALIGEDAWQEKFFVENLGPLPVIPREMDIPNPFSCLCSDIAPQQDTKEEDLFPEDCIQVEELGLCDNDTLINLMPVQVPEGFCERTCGRCDCCFPLSQVAKKEQLNTFLKIADITGNLENIEKPGFLGTVLAPTDAAFEALFGSLGITIDEVEDYVLFFKDLFSYHILPVHPFFDALWTTPFFVDGLSSKTMLHGSSKLIMEEINALNFSKTGELPSSIKGEKSSANVVQGDIEACKSYITIIDNVLLPYNIEDVVGVGSGEACAFKQGVVYKGESLAPALPADSAAVCCERCSKNEQCNVWQYCATSEGCLAPGGVFVAQGQCELKFQESFTSTEPEPQLRGVNIGSNQSQHCCLQLSPKWRLFQSSRKNLSATLRPCSLPCNGLTLLFNLSLILRVLRLQQLLLKEILKYT